MYILNDVNYELKRFHRCVEIAQSLLDKPNSSYKHFSFILKGTKIYSIGWNDVKAKSAKISGKYVDYPLGGVHAEANAIAKLDDLNVCRRATLLNLRLNNRGQIRLSKPCPICNNLLYAIGFNKIYYSTDEGIVRYD